MKILRSTKMLLGICAVLCLSACASVPQKQIPLSTYVYSINKMTKAYNEAVTARNAKYVKTKALEKSLLPRLSDAQLAAYVAVTESWHDGPRNELAMRTLVSSMERGTPEREELVDQLIDVLSALKQMHEDEPKLNALREELEADRQIVFALIAERPRAQNLEPIEDVVRVQE